MNSYNRIGRILVAAILFWPLNLAPAQSAPNSMRVDSLSESPAPEQVPPVLPASTVPSTKTPEKPPEKSRELHRLDFRIEGKSCPVCLLSIQNKLKSFSGVQDAAVMLKRPFGASVIYRSDKSSADFILMMLRAKDATVKIVDVKDSKIDEMPFPLIPPFLPAAEPEYPIPVNIPKP
jgi:hypothetical protein